jgi:hypothetical protein
MGRQRRKRQLSAGWVLLILLSLLVGCGQPMPTRVSTPGPSSLPEVTLARAPATLCRAATQLRLAPQVEGAWRQGDAAHWTLLSEGDEVLTEGRWRPENGELFVPFPDGETLAPGRYTLALALDDVTLTEHTFAISEETVTVDAFELALTPDGPTTLTLAPGARHVYLRCAYRGACPGAPYWITVRRESDAAEAGEVVCKRHGALPAARSTETVACYREQGAPLAPGAYHAELMVMGEAQATLRFDVASPPVTPSPTPSPTPTAIPPRVCEPLFTAAGLTSQGEPFLTQSRFEWYTQAIYAGSHCRNLRRGTPWEAQWYRNGERVRSAEGTWQGAETGVVWDSITGEPRSPFLLPGTYTVTLTLADTAPLTAELRLIPYIRPEPTP